MDLVQQVNIKIMNNKKSEPRLAGTFSVDLFDDELTYIKTVDLHAAPLTVVYEGVTYHRDDDLAANVPAYRAEKEVVTWRRPSVPEPKIEKAPATGITFTTGPEPTAVSLMRQAKEKLQRKIREVLKSDDDTAAIIHKVQAYEEIIDSIDEILRALDDENTN